MHIDAIVERVMRERHVAGLSLGIARRGTPMYLRGYGLRDPSDRLPADGYTIYPIGSIAKQFAAALVMHEVTAGRIALTNPVRSYVPAVSERLAAVTIAQALGQTSGVAPAGDATSAELAFDPGTAWSYSNANYALLGMVLESVTGRTYAALLHDRIAVSLSLRSTGCTVPAFARNVARGYSWSDGWAPVATGLGASDDECSTAGLVSNAADLLRWLDGLRAAQIVSAPALAAMTASGKLRNGISTHYGYGFFISNWFGYAVAQHPGYVGGFSSQDALVLDDGLEIAVLTNADAVDLTPLTKSLVAIVNPPRDRNLWATAAQAPENENPRVTAALQKAVGSPAYASLGPLRSAEFIERSTVRGTTYDTYRLTFDAGQWWATVAYRHDESIDSLSLAPA